MGLYMICVCLYEYVLHVTYVLHVIHVPGIMEGYSCCSIFVLCYCVFSVRLCCAVFVLFDCLCVWCGVCYLLCGVWCCVACVALCLYLAYPDAALSDIGWCKAALFHANSMHLYFNMSSLLLKGRLLEPVMGTAPFASVAPLLLLALFRSYALFIFSSLVSFPSLFCSFLLSLLLLLSLFSLFVDDLLFFFLLVLPNPFSSVFLFFSLCIFDHLWPSDSSFRIVSSSRRLSANSSSSSFSHLFSSFELSV
jgi:hypothetical protein